MGYAAEVRLSLFCLALLVVLASVLAAPSYGGWRDFGRDDPARRSPPGCSYKNQKFEHGEQVETPEPCLNCTCIKGVLVCYLRVCATAVAPPPGCIPAREVGQCCPTLICGPSDLQPNSDTESGENGNNQKSKSGPTDDDERQSLPDLRPTFRPSVAEPGVPDEEIQQATTHEREPSPTSITHPSSSEPGDRDEPASSDLRSRSTATSRSSSTTSATFMDENRLPQTDPRGGTTHDVQNRVEETSLPSVAQNTAHVSVLWDDENSEEVRPGDPSSSHSTSPTTEETTGSSDQDKEHTSRFSTISDVTDQKRTTVNPQFSSPSSEDDSLIFVTSSSLPSTIGETEYDDNFLDDIPGGCLVNGTLYGDGSAMISASFCEYCFCIRGKRTCLKPKCHLLIEGCIAKYDSEFTCCPSRYDCVSSPESKISGDENGPKDADTLMPTSAISTTQLPKNTISANTCLVKNFLYVVGESVPSVESCSTCYCSATGIVCNKVNCSPPVPGCKPIVPEGHCCPVEYRCDSGKKHENQLDFENHLLPPSTKFPNNESDSTEIRDASVGVESFSYLTKEPVERTTESVESSTEETDASDENSTTNLPKFTDSQEQHMLWFDNLIPSQRRVDQDLGIESYLKTIVNQFGGSRLATTEPSPVYLGTSLTEHFLSSAGETIVTMLSKSVADKRDHSDQNSFSAITGITDEKVHTTAMTVPASVNDETLENKDVLRVNVSSLLGITSDLSESSVGTSNTNFERSHGAAQKTIISSGNGPGPIPSDQGDRYFRNESTEQETTVKISTKESRHITDVNQVFENANTDLFETRFSDKSQTSNFPFTTQTTDESDSSTESMNSTKPQTTSSEVNVNETEPVTAEETSLARESKVRIQKDGNEEPVRKSTISYKDFQTNPSDMTSETGLQNYSKEQTITARNGYEATDTEIEMTTPNFNLGLITKLISHDEKTTSTTESYEFFSSHSQIDADTISKSRSPIHIPGSKDSISIETTLGSEDVTTSSKVARTSLDQQTTNETQFPSNDSVKIIKNVSSFLSDNFAEEKPVIHSTNQIKDESTNVPSITPSTLSGASKSSYDFSTDSSSSDSQRFLSNSTASSDDGDGRGDLQSLPSTIISIFTDEADWPSLILSTEIASDARDTLYEENKNPSSSSPVDDFAAILEKANDMGSVSAPPLYDQGINFNDDDLSTSIPDSSQDISLEQLEKLPEFGETHSFSELTKSTHLTASTKSPTETEHPQHTTKTPLVKEISTVSTEYVKTNSNPPFVTELSKEKEELDYDYYSDHDEESAEDLSSNKSVNESHGHSDGDSVADVTHTDSELNQTAHPNYLSHVHPTTEDDGIVHGDVPLSVEGVGAQKAATFYNDIVVRDGKSRTTESGGVIFVDPKYTDIEPKIPGSFRNELNIPEANDSSTKTPSHLLYSTPSLPPLHDLGEGHSPYNDKKKARIQDNQKNGGGKDGSTFQIIPFLPEDALMHQSNDKNQTVLMQQASTHAAPDIVSDFCFVNGRIFINGEMIIKPDPCELCRCFYGRELCQLQRCPKPPSQGCLAEHLEGFCCPRYTCGNADLEENDSNKPPVVIISEPGSSFPFSSSKTDSPEDDHDLEYNDNWDIITRSPTEGQRETTTYSVTSSPPTNRVSNEIRPTVGLKVFGIHSSKDPSLQGDIPDPSKMGFGIRVRPHPSLLITTKPSTRSTAAPDVKQMVTATPPSTRPLTRLPTETSVGTTTITATVGSTKLSRTTTTTTTTTTEAPAVPFFDPWGLLEVSGCNIYGKFYNVNEKVEILGKPCSQCICASSGVECNDIC